MQVSIPLLSILVWVLPLALVAPQALIRLPEAPPITMLILITVEPSAVLVLDLPWQFAYEVAAL